MDEYEYGTGDTMGIYLIPIFNVSISYFFSIFHIYTYY